MIDKKDKAVAAKKYRKRLGWVPYLELLVGTYFALTVWYAIANENYITVPFLILFVFGYWYTGLMSLLQGRFDSMLRDRAEEHSPKALSGRRVEDAISRELWALSREL